MPTNRQSPTSKVTQLLQSHPFDLGTYEETYKHLHANPELSQHESETASLIAKHPALSGYTVHTSIGGHGVAGVLSNGDGPVVLLRADMDALPVEEKTGLPYASKMRAKDADGNDTPVMHACGHDMHVACLLAAAAWLASDEVKKLWAGTLVLVFQPNEEGGQGAQAMVDDGLYSKVPVPDVVLGQHVMPMRAGKVAVKKGTMIAAADSYKITLYGRGGHGSMPQICVDPVVLAASIVMRLQTIVARRVDPAEPAVLTVGSLQAGHSENVIADEAVLKVDIRSQHAATRERVLRSMRKIVEKECEAGECPKPPQIEQIRKFPLTVNDQDVTTELSGTFKEIFGEEFDPAPPTSNASEDVSDLATSVDKPYCFWLVGGIDDQKFDEAEKNGRIVEDIPVNHSAYFAPVIQPTLKTGFTTLSAAALTYLKCR